MQIDDLFRPGSLSFDEPFAHFGPQSGQINSLAAEYLKAAIEETEEPKVLLLALRRPAEARGEFTNVAKAGH